MSDEERQRALHAYKEIWADTVLKGLERYVARDCIVRHRSQMSVIEPFMLDMYAEYCRQRDRINLIASKEVPAHG
jgi:hypothetical protein